MNAVLSCYRAVVKNESSEGRHLVPRFINTVTFVDGAYEARSRREEESRLDLGSVALPANVIDFIKRDTSSYNSVK